MTSRMKVLGPALGALLSVTVIIIMLGSHENRVAALEPHSENAVAESCRAGVSVHGSDQVEWVDKVGAGWYVFFGGYESAENGASIAPIISVEQNKVGAIYLDTYTIEPPLAGLLPLLQTYPGTLWIVGNEVDRGPNPGETLSGQGDTFPDVYARAYDEVYHFIKEHDPSALVANSGLVQVTPGRLQYLDLMWQSYLDQFGKPMPVDVWNMHVYVLPEAELDGTPNGIANVALGTDPGLAKRGPGTNSSMCDLEQIYCYAEHDSPTIFADQIRAMRSWMVDHGQQYKPLILTEFSIILPCHYPGSVGSCDFWDEFGNDFDGQRVQNWLATTTSYLESASDPHIGYPFDNGRLVQRWAWFSISTTTQVGDVSDLVARSGDNGPLVALNELGQQYYTMATNLPTYVNLAPAGVPAVTANTTTPGGTVDVQLRANLVNNGSLPLDSAFQVTFYADSALTQVIGQAEVTAPDASDPVLADCALRTVPVNVTWPGLAAGLHPFWVELDSQNDIEESTEDDNVTSSFVLVNPQQLSLPSVAR